MDPATWTIAFALSLTSAILSTILLNKICKCAPQHYSLWFNRFGGFVELPLLFLYIGAVFFSAGICVALYPVYNNPLQTFACVVLFAVCGSLVNNVYSDTTDFEKACTKTSEKFSSQGAGEGAIMADYARRRGVTTDARDWEYDQNMDLCEPR